MPFDSAVADSPVKLASPLARRFYPQIAAPFFQKFVSEERTGADRTAVVEFFTFAKGIPPELVELARVAALRDHLHN